MSVRLTAVANLSTAGGLGGSDSGSEGHQSRLQSLPHPDSALRERLHRDYLVRICHHLFSAGVRFFLLQVGHSKYNDFFSAASIGKADKMQANQSTVIDAQKES